MTSLDKKCECMISRGVLTDFVSRTSCRASLQVERLLDKLKCEGCHEITAHGHFVPSGLMPHILAIHPERDKLKFECSHEPRIMKKFVEGGLLQHVSTVVQVHGQGLAQRNLQSCALPQRQCALIDGLVIKTTLVKADRIGTANDQTLLFPFRPIKSRQRGTCKDGWRDGCAPFVGCVLCEAMRTTSEIFSLPGHLFVIHPHAHAMKASLLFLSISPSGASPRFSLPVVRSRDVALQMFRTPLPT